jgi:hypothetical protein
MYISVDWYFFSLGDDFKMISSDIWMNKENTISNVYLQLDNSRPETPVDMLVQSPPQRHHTNNYCNMINIYILCPRSLNNCVENLKIQINQYLDTQNNRTKSINRINSSGQLVAILQKFCRVKFQFIVVCV